ncbi:MAG: dynamin family protein [Paracoccaceae bacterium]
MIQPNRLNRKEQTVDMSLQDEDQLIYVSKPQPSFADSGMKPLMRLRDDFEDLQENLFDILAIGDESVSPKISDMQTELEEFAPAVTFIGQIKSGKTTLLNAMVGRPGLLPSDVNPWTSVVTSLHLNAPRDADSPAARFQFFDKAEWDHLVQDGGRIGELSARMGAEQEHAKLRDQVDAMFQKTKARLGHNFEMLLGQAHVYSYLKPDLVRRYVCLGDDFDSVSHQDSEGKYADITKSADLYFDAPEVPMGMVLRDTPGLNDTFLMREHVTIKSIQDSELCVVVLSAHQALNTVDMALIRLISNVKSRQVVLFVNRIDELSEPVDQIPEIRDSLRDTLLKHTGHDDYKIVFGSALWANAALQDSAGDLPPDCVRALEAYGTASDIPGLHQMDQNSAVWELSGVPELQRILGHQIAATAGAIALNTVRKRAQNIVSGLHAGSKITALYANSDDILKLSESDVSDKLDALEAQARQSLNTALDSIFSDFTARVDQAHDHFLARATSALVDHLERKGDQDVWHYSPDGLRLLLRKAYGNMSARLRREVDTVFDKTAQGLVVTYGQIFDVTVENFAIQTPSQLQIPSPVMLAQTIVLDVKASWWKSWWHNRKGYRAFAGGFQDLIRAETAPMMTDLKHRQTKVIRTRVQASFDQFLGEQRMVLNDICAKSQVSLKDLHEIFGVTSQQDRDELFAIIQDDLSVQLDATAEALT